MSIFNNLKTAHAAIVVDMARHSIDPKDNTSGKLGAEINNLAVEALTHGINSDAWREYMSLFASNEAELAHLSDPKKTEDPKFGWLRQFRAYIVSNAICDIGTNGKTHDKITDEINILEDQVDAGFVAKRRIKIPPVPPSGV